MSSRLKEKDIVGYLTYNITIYSTEWKEIFVLNENFFYNKEKYRGAINLETLLSGNEHKPRLIPLSKITKEDLSTINLLISGKVELLGEEIIFIGECFNLIEINSVLDYLYSRHYDINNLIKQGLAIEI